MDRDTDSIFLNQQFFGGSGECNEKMKEHHKSRDNTLLILMISETSEKPLKLMMTFHLLVGYKVNTIPAIFLCKSSWKLEKKRTKISHSQLQKHLESAYELKQ